MKNLVIVESGAKATKITEYLDKIDLVFTDPPYGIDVVKNNSVGGGKIAKTNNYNEP